MWAWTETQKLGGTVKGHFSLEAPRRGSVGGAGTHSYLLSPRSRVLSFMRAVRAYPRVAGRDIWDCSTLSSSANTSSSSTFQGDTGSDPGASPASPDMSLLSVSPTQDPPAGAQFPHSSLPAGGPHIPRCTRLPPAPAVAAWDEKHDGPVSMSPPPFQTP